ncbi:MAG: hypothetical protein JNK49_18770 [Planctomycetes bacterium]|nr:hypothetical protein [Planctomycetota bacterium]
MNRIVFLGSLPALLLHSLPAQTLQIDLAAVQPLVVSATAGQTATASAPAGPLAATGRLNATPAPGVEASCSWRSSAGAELGGVLLGHSVQTTGGGATAAVGPLEYLVTLTTSVSTRTFLQVERQDEGGMPAATIALDLDNDGVYERSVPLGNPLTPLARTLSPVPYQFRVRIANQLAGPGAAGGQLSVMVLPDNQLSSVPTAVSCSPFPDVLFGGYPVFPNTGYTFYGNSYYSNKLSAMVVGLAAQPTLLPSLTAVPCLLVPRPDAVVLLLPGQRIEGVRLEVPLPPSVRPLTLQAQLVYLEPSGQPSVGEGFAVSAR